MSAKSMQLYKWVGKNRSKLAATIAMLALITTSLSEYIYTSNLDINLTLGLGNGICAFIMVYVYHYLLFSKIKTQWLKYALITIFPPVLMLFLITSFATVSTLLNYSVFDVTFKHQIILLGFFILGQGYFYLIFTPKIPFIITCLVAIWLFIGGIKSNQ